MLALILLAATILRLVAINQSVWLDEAININIVRAIDFQPLIFSYSLGDFHPPLFHIYLKSWFIAWQYFGLPIAEFTFRLPSILFGTATVFVTYLIGKKLFAKNTAIVAAALMATAPLHIYYSQEARMYSLAAFLTSLSVYFFFSILEKDKLINYLGFIATTALMLYSDYLPYLIIAVYFLFLLSQREHIKKHVLKSLVPSFILIFLLVLPWLFILPKQLAVGLSAANASPSWAQVVGTPGLKSLAVTFVKFTIGRISLDNDFYYALAITPIAAFVGFLLFLSILRVNFKRTFLYFWFFGATLTGFLIAFIIPIFAYFRFIFVLPAFYLIIASGITIINHKWLTRVLFLLAILINLASSGIYLTNSKYHREDWKNAVKFVASGDTQKTVVLFESNYTMAPFDYYNEGKVEGFGGLDSFDASTSDIKTKVEKYTQGKNKVYLFQYLSGITDPQGLLFRQLSLSGFGNTKTNNFNGVGFVYEFER